MTAPVGSSGSAPGEYARPHADSVRKERKKSDVSLSRSQRFVSVKYGKCLHGIGVAPTLSDGQPTNVSSVNHFQAPEAGMSVTHLHLLLNHFPVIGTILGIALLAIALMRRSSELGKVSLGLFAALGAISVLVYFTGEPAEEAIEKLPGFSEAITERHEEFALIATIILTSFGTLALGALAVFRNKSLPRWVTLGSFAISLVAGVLMGYTGMLGGQVRHTEIRSSAITSIGASLDVEDKD
jgi:uncharacterized membrane protein